MRYRSRSQRWSGPRSSQPLPLWPCGGDAVVPGSSDLLLEIRLFGEYFHATS